MTDTRTAAARLNAVRRWHPTDRDRIAAAERELRVARAAALAAEVAALLGGKR